MIGEAGIVGAEPPAIWRFHVAIDVHIGGALSEPQPGRLQGRGCLRRGRPHCHFERLQGGIVGSRVAAARHLSRREDMRRGKGVAGADDGFVAVDARNLAQDGVEPRDHRLGDRGQVHHGDRHPDHSIVQQQNTDSQRIVFSGETIERKQAVGENDIRSPGSRRKRGRCRIGV
ncbi:hypothetical protein FY133_24705 (plasmid) [Agrobacterium tumefaciens]|uniref:Uncharacterized protein n=1 Tax=Agrobacterium tumefaciens TaxID=358 RepID=A0AAP9J996_AGRTU|nr:hypothetical protein [Agrobacterium tumefaciens]NSZ60034.1 hypothetical protein [Agrobacterium tumefaciens]QDY97637.1 hypothetical protein CG010_026110 [Agrobacterium tumefaciens]UXS12761.1 hypothetical protein FY155_24255 [Agrobacterium tumefaciens]UXS20123.1 hypothetical protein FY154_24250 [Agrobacterium tumefaciens]UXS27770.1 hypothetical protein FY153_25090 [Agrobacterium tumefaciens]